MEFRDVSLLLLRRILESTTQLEQNLIKPHNYNDACTDRKDQEATERMPRKEKRFLAIAV